MRSEEQIYGLYPIDGIGMRLNNAEKREGAIKGEVLDTKVAGGKIFDKNQSRQSVTSRLTFGVAAFALKLDGLIRNVSEEIFELFPAQFKAKLVSMNSEYKRFRNHALGMNEVRLSNPIKHDAQNHSEKLNRELSADCLLDEGANPENGNDRKCPPKGEPNTEVQMKLNNQIVPPQWLDCDQEQDLELQRGDVPGWVLVVLMTTGLVTALWAIAAPRLSTILKNSLDSMNSVR